MSTTLIGIFWAAAAVAIVPAVAWLILSLAGAGVQSDTGPAQATPQARRTAMLAYVLGPVSGLATLLLERRDPFVRFHAAQAFLAGSLGVGVSYLMLFPLLLLAMIPPVGWMAAAIIGTVFVLSLATHWIRLMAQGYRGREWEDLLVGEYARRLAVWRGTWRVISYQLSALTSDS